MHSFQIKLIKEVITKDDHIILNWMFWETKLKSVGTRYYCWLLGGGGGGGFTYLVEGSFHSNLAKSQATSLPADAAEHPDFRWKLT